MRLDLYEVKGGNVTVVLDQDAGCSIEPFRIPDRQTDREMNKIQVHTDTMGLGIQKNS